MLSINCSSSRTLARDAFLRSNTKEIIVWSGDSGHEISKLSPPSSHFISPASYRLTVSIVRNTSNLHETHHLVELSRQKREVRGLHPRFVRPVWREAQAFDLAGTLALGVPHPSRTLRRVGVGMFTQWDGRMSHRRHRVPPLQRTQGRRTHSRVIGEETKTEDRAIHRRFHGQSMWPRISRSQRLMAFLPDPIPGVPMPAYLANTLSLRTGRIRTPSPSHPNRIRSPA